MDEAEIQRQLTRAREAYRLSPTEANARECERLYALTEEGKQWEKLLPGKAKEADR